MNILNSYIHYTVTYILVTSCLTLIMDDLLLENTYLLVRINELVYEKASMIKFNHSVQNTLAVADNANYFLKKKWN